MLKFISIILQYKYIMKQHPSNNLVGSLNADQPSSSKRVMSNRKDVVSHHNQQSLAAPLADVKRNHRKTVGPEKMMKQQMELQKLEDFNSIRMGEMKEEATDKSNFQSQQSHNESQIESFLNHISNPNNAQDLKIDISNYGSLTQNQAQLQQEKQKQETKRKQKIVLQKSLQNSPLNSKSSSNFGFEGSHPYQSPNPKESKANIVEQSQTPQREVTDHGESQSSTERRRQEQKTEYESMKNTLLNAMSDEKSNIPEPMPIIRKVSLLHHEPDIFLRMRRGKTYNNVYANCDLKEVCVHDELIENWQCCVCKNIISKFEHVFDDNQGRVSTFTKILYENSFLSDFKKEFRSQQTANLRATSQNPLVLYTAYQPSNVQELKEYMFYVMSKDILKKQKRDGIQSPLGSGKFQNLSSKLMNYLYSSEELKKRFRKRTTPTLWFDSIFESGNLLQAQRSLTTPDTFNLFMQVDTNTRGHQQWFYFRVKGGVKGETYVFNIMNFTKPGLTGGKGYKAGEHNMRIHYKSKKKGDQWQQLTYENSDCEYVKTNVARRKKDVLEAAADSDQEDWVEEAFIDKTNQPVAGEAITEAQQMRLQLNPDLLAKEKVKKRKVFYYYALRFKYEFEHDDDTVYFSFAKPVTYSEILTDIHNKEMEIMPTQQRLELSKSTSLKPKNFQKALDVESEQQESKAMLFKPQFLPTMVIDNPRKFIYYQRKELCRTLSGVPLYKIWIGRDQRSIRKNQIVLITSRVHSGETPGSEVFSGIYEFLTSDLREARYLRRFYTFLLVPCMNPDGVICGNYRNSVAGVDLNRQWINPEPMFHPEVDAVKSLMQQIKEEDKRQIWIFCDLHGHSKKRNSFFYGCNTAANGGFLSWTIVRLLPRIFAKLTHMFNYKDCRFRVEPYKIGTARVVAWKQFQITHSFTLENSFYGYDIGEDETRVFSAQDYKDVGVKFSMAIYEMHSVWKDIQRELQVTHGWLKPRILNIMTGVPAAQIMAEETAQLKEQERKKKAIEQYEQFLRKFYDTTTFNRREQAKAEEEASRNQPNILKGSLMNQKKDKTRNSTQQQIYSEDIPSAGFKDEQASAQPGLKQAKKDDLNSEQNRANDGKQATEKKQGDQPDEEYIFKMHQGLVKIQALIRGFLQRKAYRKRVEKRSGKLDYGPAGKSANIPRMNSNQVLKEKSQGRRVSKKPNKDKLKLHCDTSSDNALRNAATPGTGKLNNEQGSSNDEDFLRANTEQIAKQSDTITSHRSHEAGPNLLSSAMQQKQRMDWREYFEGEELDKAYQIVEVEQRDETDNEEDENRSMGSNSNPSEDNLDEEEVYRNVYGVKNPEVLIESRKIKQKEFIDKVQKEELASPELDRKNRNNDSKKNINEIKSERSKAKLDSELKKFKPSTSQEKLINQGAVLNKVQRNSKRAVKKAGNLPNEEESKSLLPPDRSEENFQNASMLNNDLQTQKVVSLDPSLKKNTQSPTLYGDAGPEPTIQSLNYQGRRALRSSNQQRSSIAPNLISNNMSMNNPVRMIQQCYKLQQSNYKKENINQVIKDCFITKKMVTNVSNTTNSSALIQATKGIMASGQKPTQSKRQQQSKPTLKTTNSSAEQQMINKKKVTQQALEQILKGFIQPNQPANQNLLSQYLAYQEQQIQKQSVQGNKLMMKHNLAGSAGINTELTDHSNEQIGSHLTQVNHAYNPQSQAHMQSAQGNILINQFYPNIYQEHGSDQKLYFYPSSKVDKSKGKVLNNVSSMIPQSFSALNYSAPHSKDPHHHTLPKKKREDYAMTGDGSFIDLGKHIEGTPQMIGKKTQYGQDKVKFKDVQHASQPSNQVLVTSGLITDHKEGHNNLFVYGKSGIDRGLSDSKPPRHGISSAVKSDKGQSLFMKYVQKKAARDHQLLRQNGPGSHHEKHSASLTTPEKVAIQTNYGTIPQSSIVVGRAEGGKPIPKTQKHKLIKSEQKRQIENPIILQNMIILPKEPSTKLAAQQMGGMYTHTNIHQERPLLGQPPRVKSAALMAQSQAPFQQHNQMIEDKVDTKELIHEIKQLKAQQQQQLQFFYNDLQQSINRIESQNNQIQKQFEDQRSKEPGASQQFFQINQYNVGDQARSFYQTTAGGDLQKSAKHMTPYNQGKEQIGAGPEDDWASQIKPLGEPARTASGAKQKKQYAIVQLQAQDKIPVGLQGLMNRQNINQVLSQGSIFPPNAQKPK